MRHFSLSIIAGAIAVPAAIAIVGSVGAQEEADRPIAHMVFFELETPSADGRYHLVRGCEKYLSGHPGTLHFSAGEIASDMKRDVNDRDFDVALHIVFRDKAAHDRYQEAERHLKFIEEFQDSWAKVRVFDSYLHSVRPRPRGDRPRVRREGEGLRPRRIRREGEGDRPRVRR